MVGFVVVKRLHQKGRQGARPAGVARGGLCRAALPQLPALARGPLPPPRDLLFPAWGRAWVWGAAVLGSRWFCL